MDNSIQPAPGNVSEATRIEPVDTSTLPLWQRRYLAAIQAGADRHEACRVANVNTSTIMMWTTPGEERYSPAFARAHDAAHAGVAVLGVEHCRQLAVQLAPTALLDAFDTSRDPAVGQRDRLGNRRTVLEAARILGQGAQQQAAGPIIQLGIHASITVAPPSQRVDADVVDGA